MESQRQRRDKKHQQQKSKVINRYYFSCGTSLLVHGVILLILALMYEATSHSKPIRLAIDFSSEPIPIDFVAADLELPKLDSYTESAGAEGGDWTSLVPEADPAPNLDVKYQDLAINTYQDIFSYVTTNELNSIVQVPLSISHSINPNISRRRGNRDNMGEGEQGVSGVGSGGDGEIERRLKEAGAKTGDIQISIAWNNYNDIDVWLEYKDPSTHNAGLINWMNRSVSHGYLDIDMNYRPQTDKAVENIYWEEGEAPFGIYNIYIQNYHQWEKSIDSTIVDVRIVFDGKVVNKKCTVKLSDGVVKVFTYARKPTKELIAKKEQRQNLKEINGPYTFTPFGYTPDNIVIPPAPTFQ